VTCRQFPQPDSPVFDIRSTENLPFTGSNLSLHRYHATASHSIHGFCTNCKSFFNFCKKIFLHDFFNKIFRFILKIFTDLYIFISERKGDKISMWIADQWKDYEVLDAADGEKLERWGDYLLVRPDPQIIWNTPRRHAGWNKPNAHYHRSSKGGGEWEIFDLPEEWSIRYHNQTFRLKPFQFKHTGLFPEQAVNWDWFSQIIRREVSRRSSGEPVKVLNLFAYTGGATLSAAAAGAHVTHVDASKGMVTWAKENAAASGLSKTAVRWLVDDCVKFVEREIRRGSRYDAIIMDPPSYGRGPKGEIWKLEDNIFPFLKLCAGLLSENPLFMLLNAYTTGLQPAVLSYLLNIVLCKRLGGHVESGEIGLPVSSSGLILPCGASGRWFRDIL